MTRPDPIAARIREVLGRHPEVRDVAVLAAGVLAPGRSAVVVPLDYATGPELVAFLRDQAPELPPPELIVLVPAIPGLDGGGPDAGALAALLPTWPSVYRYQAAATGVERDLADIWSKALDRRVAGVHDDFIESGGDSLGAARIIVEISARFGTDLSVEEFFELATIDGIARRLESR